MINQIKKRLEYLRGEIEAESISTLEIAELQGLKDHISPGDTVLLEWAGAPEDETEKRCYARNEIEDADGRCKCTNEDAG